MYFVQRRSDPYLQRLMRDPYLHVFAFCEGYGEIMQDSGTLDRVWRHSGSAPFYATMTFTDAGLFLGWGTLLAAFAKNGRNKGQRAASQIFSDSHEARLLSLLTAAYGRPIAESAVDEIGRAGRSWCSGQ